MSLQSRYLSILPRLRCLAQLFSGVGVNAVSGARELLRNCCPEARLEGWTRSKFILHNRIRFPSRGPIEHFAGVCDEECSGA